ncbi:WD40-repeat-containing domain protein [Mycena olivaceomarginata]|nr:WD40-repeat-containing domain protein [Mycena olivaceomarginata]
MPKHASVKAPVAKKARIEPPQKLSASRVKGSPVPQKKPSLKGKEKEKVSSAPRKRKSAAETEAPLPKTFKVVAGSYEKLLYGLEGSVSYDAENNSALLPPKTPVAASPHGGKWLATGSADEIVKVWDLRRRKGNRRPHAPRGSVTARCVCSAARDWAVLRALRGHKGRVNSVAVHPTGKVALSVGKDRTLRMWDLMRGKGCASTKLGKEAELVRWSSDGSLFVDMNLIHTITHPSRLQDVKFCARVNGAGDVLLAGAEDKKLSVYELSTDPEKPPRVIAEMTGHANRVKAIATLPIALPPASGRASTTVVCTASSDGKIHVYDLAALPAQAGSTVLEMTPVAEYDSKGTRLTCVTLADGDVEESGAVNGKRKRAADEEDEEEEDEDEGEGAEEWGGVGGADVGGEAGDDDSAWEDEEEAEEEAEVESD